MPYLRTLVLDNVHISFWRLDESSEEMWTLLRTLTDVSPYAERFSRIGSEKRRCEWVAARCLVHRNVGASAKVAYHATGRPFLFSPGAEAPAEISVTHAANLVAVCKEGMACARTFPVRRRIAAFVHAGRSVGRVVREGSHLQTVRCGRIQVRGRHGVRGYRKRATPNEVALYGKRRGGRFV